MLKIAQYKLLSIPIWRKLLFFIIIVAFVYIDAKTYEGYKLSLLEFIIIHFNEPKTIDYFYLLIIMIICADIYNGAQNPYEDMLVLKVGGRKKWFIQIIIYSVIISFGMICIYLLIAYGIGALEGFSGMYLHSQFEELNNLNSFKIIGEIILLSGFRILFLNVLIIAINMICINNPMGFLAAFVISIVDMFVYEAFDIMQPWGVTPLEHTRVLYTEAVAPAISGALRIPLIYSVLYWVVGILAFVIFAYIIALKKDFLVKSVKF